MRYAPTSCGDANPKGNVSFSFKGACGKRVALDDAYRCTGCGGWFHRDCIFNHFEEELSCSRAHNALKQIDDYAVHLNLIDEAKVRELCRWGLDRSFLRKSFFPKL